MDRLVLTTEQQATVAQARIDNNIAPSDQVLEGTNLVQDDNVRVCDAWNAWVIGPGSGVVLCYVPDWDYLAPIDIVDYVTDRAGPNGETMPVIDPVQMEARLAAAAAKNPKHAAHGHHHAAPRTLQDLLDEQTPEVRKELHHQLVKHHLLGKG